MTVATAKPVLLQLDAANQTVTYQGFTIDAPPSPSGQGQFVNTPYPSSPEVVAKTSIEISAGNGEQKPVYTTVTAQFYWNEIYSVETQNGSASHTVSYTYGVQSSTSETETFAVSIGLEESATFAGIGEKLSASFTASTGITNTITLDQSTTTSDTFNFDANTTAQVWQLIQVFEDSGGDSLTQSLVEYLLLTYPAPPS